MNAGARRHFNEELQEVQEQLMRMAGLAEEMVEVATTALAERNREALSILKETDARVDALEVTLDEHILELMALQQPMASDLRFLFTALKISNDLERVGDHAVNLGRAARKMAKRPPIADLTELGEMASITREMLRDALSAFVSRDVDTAVAVCARDDAVDDLRKSLFRILVTHMFEDPKTITPALDALRAAQNLERIADLATNVSEEVVFLVTGESIKHGGTLPDHDRE
jgi:phosphate transport system protein